MTFIVIYEHNTFHIFIKYKSPLPKVTMLISKEVSFSVKDCPINNYVNAIGINSDNSRPISASGFLPQICHSIYYVDMGNRILLYK